MQPGDGPEVRRGARDEHGKSRMPSAVTGRVRQGGVVAALLRCGCCGAGRRTGFHGERRLRLERAFGKLPENDQW